MKNILKISLVGVLMAGGAAAKPSLRDVTVIEEGLFTITVADKIRRECGTIAGRLFKAQRKMREMADHAVSLGYTEAEIRAYVDSGTEKTRMRARRDAYLSSKGVVKSSPETYCAVGRSEIQKSSQIGGLLRAR